MVSSECRYVYDSKRGLLKPYMQLRKINVLRN